MKQSQLFNKTIKTIPREEESINAKLLIRAGFIHKEMAGVWSFLPLGLRVIRKIENIIREEMNAIGGQELLMTVLQPKSLWQETGRWSNGMEAIIYKVENGEIGLGPTHEEEVCDIARTLIKSKDDLPLYLYQIQSKFRKEPRAKSGLLRCREFEMKDLYSFHSSQKDFEKYYEVVKKSYFKIFKKFGLNPFLTQASGGEFTKDFTHEFQVLSQSGEDKIIYCPSSHFSQNKEISKVKAGDKCPLCSKILKQGDAIEVGNIFPLKDKFSKKMNLSFFDEKGEKRNVMMGCYGIGVSRIMGTIVEIYHDQNGIIWPKEVAPFSVHLIPIEISNSKVKKTTEKIYQNLQERNIDILYDDRQNKSPGEKFAEADLIGIPFRIVISEKTLKTNCLELKKRGSAKKELIKINDIFKKLNV